MTRSTALTRHQMEGDVVGFDALVIGEDQQAEVVGADVLMQRRNVAFTVVAWDVHADLYEAGPGKANSRRPTPKKNWGFDDGKPLLRSVSLTQSLTSSASMPHWVWRGQASRKH